MSQPTPPPGDKYLVERSTVIEAPPRRVYAELADFRRWQAWSPWEGLDPDLQRDYSGAGAGTGAVYRWKGNRKAGQGSMTITRADEPSLVHIDLTFEKPFKSRNDTRFSLAPTGADGGSTEVTWTMVGTKTFMTRVMGLFTSMDKMIGPDFEKGLRQLKDVAEKPRT
jgi:uncharacterized protein YndB with AHSA1/START domain